MKVASVGGISQSPDSRCFPWIVKLFSCFYCWVQRTTVYHRIVLLRICIHQLNSIHKQLEPLWFPRITVFLRQWRHGHRMIHDEGWLDALGFDVMPDECIDDSRQRNRFCYRNTLVLANLKKGWNTRFYSSFTKAADNHHSNSEGCPAFSSIRQQHQYDGMEPWNRSLFHRCWFSWSHE